MELKEMMEKADALDDATRRFAQSDNGRLWFVLTNPETFSHKKKTGSIVWNPALIQHYFLALRHDTTRQDWERLFWAELTDYPSRTLGVLARNYGKLPDWLAVMGEAFKKDYANLVSLTKRIDAYLDSHKEEAKEIFSREIGKTEPEPRQEEEEEEEDDDAPAFDPRDLLLDD